MRKLLRLTLLLLLSVLSLLNDQPSAFAQNPAYDIIPMPVGSTPTLDGVCDPTEYADADSVSFDSQYGGFAYSVGVYYKRDDSDLYVCLDDMPRGDPDPGDFAAVYVDRDRDGGAQARAGDYQLTITQTGITDGGAGDNAGAYSGPNPGGWTAQRSTGDFFWDAEFRISEATLGGWGNVVGLSFAHHWVQRAGDDYAWPDSWSWIAPGTWPHFGLYRARLNVPEGTTPTVDGACDGAEYQDAGTISFVSSYGATDYDVDLYLKHDRSDLYICFDELPRGDQPPAGPGDFVAVTLDANNDRGLSPRSDDVQLILEPDGATDGASGTGFSFGGPDPGGWTAAAGGNEFFWDAEFRIPRNLAGGWDHSAGITLQHRSVRSLGDDYGWPAGTDPDRPTTWGDAVLEAPSVQIGLGSAATLDGVCNVSAEYDDVGAGMVTIPSEYGGNPFPATVYLKHTADHLFICFNDLPRGDPDPGDFAAVYLDRDRDRAQLAASGDYAFTIDQNGNLGGNSGNGAGGYSGPDPGGWTAQRSTSDFFWDAEFRIDRVTVGGWGRTVGLALFHNWVTFTGDDYSWSNTSIWNAPNSWGAGRLLLTAAATDNDLTVSDIEVNQAIQSLDNEVVLVADKTTVVRVHVRASQDEAPEVTARLYGRRDGALLGPPLFPTNPGGRITILTDPDRGQLDDSFYFLLPRSWTEAGTLALEAVANPERAVAEESYSNNSRSVTVTFQDSPPLRLTLVPIRYTFDGGTHLASDFHRLMLHSWLTRAYPVPYVSTRIVTRDYPESNVVPNADGVNNLLGQMRSLDLAAGGDRRTVYYGMVDESGGFMRGKSAGIPASAASGPTGNRRWTEWDTDGSYGDWYGGHEIGHARGRYHAEFCGAGGGRSYPYRDGRISPPDGRFYGFDTERLQVYPPTWTDVMTYCDFQWISDFTYEGIRDYLVDRESRRPPRLTGEYLAVFGMLTLEDNSVELESFYRLTDPTDIPERLPGDYTIRLLDGTGNTLADYPFTPHLNDPGPPEPGGDPDPGPETALINEVVPWDAQTERVVILFEGAELAGRAVSANSPTLQVTAPNGGETFNSGVLTVDWTASDTDGDDLSYILQYSPDGGSTWSTLTTGVTETSYDLLVADLPGGDQALIRVLASDGIQTAQDQSDGTFTVGGKDPTVTIFAPTDGDRFASGQMIPLQGSALDLEDGTLLDDDLRWSSDVDGDLGSGTLLPVTLSTGAHTITLTATDSDGQSASAEISLVVGDEPVASAGLAVSPAGFTILSVPGDPPTQIPLSVRDQAGGILNWTAAEDQPWLSLDPAAGRAPGGLTVTVAGGDLSPGTYYGAVTVAADTALVDSSRVVSITLVVVDAKRLYLPLIEREP